jgi:hypothetical protein
MTPVSFGASGRAWSDALMIVWRFFADPAIGDPFGYDSASVQKRENGIKLKQEKDNSNW